MSRSLIGPVKLGKHKVGLLWNSGSLWVGAHWSSYTRRWCINIVPCLTVWVTLPGGKLPTKEAA